MLYGVRRDLQKQLAKDGYTCESSCRTENMVSLLHEASGRTARKRLFCDKTCSRLARDGKPLLDTVVRTAAI